MTFPIVIQMTPTVATVPKADPVSTETKQLIRKTTSIKIDGIKNEVDSSIIIGMVPAARQIAVIMPIRTKISNIPLTCLMPSYEKRIIFLKENPLINPYEKNRIKPNAKANKMEKLNRTQMIKLIENKANMKNSTLTHPY